MNLYHFAEARPESAGWDFPPDAGASVLGAYGLANCVWMLAHNPEALDMTLNEFRAGLRPPACPRCRRPMRLRMAGERGNVRDPVRAVWKCFAAVYSHRTHLSEPCPGSRELKTPRSDAPRVRFVDLVSATRQGMILDYQPNPITGRPEPQLVQPPKTKPRKRR